MRKRDFSERASLANFLRSRALSSNSQSEARALAYLYGDFLSHNLTDIFVDSDFQIRMTQRYSKSKPKRELLGAVHYITNPLETGGHTQLFSRMVESQIKSGDKVSVISRVPHTIIDTLRDIGVSTYIASDLDELFEVLPTETLYLHNHPRDLDACIFADRASAAGCKVNFVNHADHTFSFQPLHRVNFLEVSGYGAAITKRYRIADSQSFIGIPSPILEEIHWKPSAERFLVTMARRDKVRPYGDLNYPRFVNSLTLRHEIPLIIFGQTGAEPWWSEYKRNDFLEFRGYQPLENIIPFIQRSFGYIDSFPLTGGTVLTLVGSIGVPIFSLKHGAVGYNVLEQVRQSTLVDLNASLDKYLTNGILPYDLNLMKETVDMWHSDSKFQERVEKTHLNKPLDIPTWALLKDGDVDIFDVRSQLFPVTRFPFELESAIMLSTRIRILFKIFPVANFYSDLTCRSFFVSLIGRGGSIYKKMRNIIKFFQRSSS
ncbi:hypothetical protein [Thioclava sp. IC9]|uniref:hypothetical protein n=1 Tax=Thioclava sp. IC9 TaxID=1973007 RepID=UPI001130CB4E|nr:hypothetical protein [Thioclava sp. IC9]